MFATTCNVAHDRWPHRFILDDIMTHILVQRTLMTLALFSDCKRLGDLWHNDSYSFFLASFEVSEHSSPSWILKFLIVFLSTFLKYSCSPGKPSGLFPSRPRSGSLLLHYSCPPGKPSGLCYWVCSMLLFILSWCINLVLNSSTTGKNPCYFLTL